MYLSCRIEQESAKLWCLGTRKHWQNLPTTAENITLVKHHADGTISISRQDTRNWSGTWSAALSPLIFHSYNLDIHLHNQALGFFRSSWQGLHGLQAHARTKRSPPSLEPLRQRHHLKRFWKQGVFACVCCLTFQHRQSRAAALNLTTTRGTLPPKAHPRCSSEKTSADGPHTHRSWAKRARGNLAIPPFTMVQ